VRKGERVVKSISRALPLFHRRVILIEIFNLGKTTRKEER
jgi:hypothetical protein